jgi:HAD superfamily hydrolase (TIGR01509 family)
MNVPRAVVFDMDGLMFNTEDVYFQVGTELLARRGHEFTWELNLAVLGRPPQACFEEMIRWCSLDESWEELAAESEEICLRLLGEVLAPMPGLLDLLDALEAAAIPKAICTSSTRNVLETVLARFAMKPRFAFTLTAQDVSHGKPHPEIYLEAARRFHIDPAEMLVLEDSPIGCRSAAAAGAFVVAVPGKYSRDDDFSVASRVIDGLDDRRLREILKLDAG